jgi:hypothetical protein
MTKDQRLCLIDTFRETLFEKNLQAISQDHAIPVLFEIDRFLLKDILHLLNQYERETTNNEIQ